MTTHQRYEAHLLTILLALICTLACVCAVVPAVEHAVTLVLLAVGGPVALAVVVRLALRWLRERREDRADALTAAAWRAEHAPHLVGVA